MTVRTLVVVTAGLPQPSSTRLLADRLAAAAQRALAASGAQVKVDVIEVRTRARAAPSVRLPALGCRPQAVYAATSDWGSAGGVDTNLAHRIDRASGELARLIGDSRATRHTDPFDSPTAFADLLVAT